MYWCGLVLHWNRNVVIWMKFSSLDALKVVISTTFSVTSDENFSVVDFTSILQYLLVACPWGWGIGVFWECKIWFMFCLSYCSAVKNVMLYLTRAYFFFIVILDPGLFFVLAPSKFRLCLANHRTGYFSNLACDWLSIVWAYSEEEIENRPRL